MIKYHEHEMKNMVKELQTIADARCVRAAEMLEQLLKEIEQPEDLSIPVLNKVVKGLDDIIDDLDNKSFELGRLRTLLKQ